MLDKNYDVVCFGAHPDDIEFGMGGTVAKLAKSGKSVLMVCFTRGEKGTYGTPEGREAELANAANAAGANHHLIGWVDCEFENTYENKMELVKIIRAAKPDICFAPYHTHFQDHHNGAAHPDHLRCGMMVKDALRYAKFKNVMPEIEKHDVRRIFYYMVPRDIKPSFVINVSDVKDTMAQMIRCHESQLSIHKGNMFVEEMLMKYREVTGLFSQTKFSEAFLCEEVLKAGVDELFTL